MRRLQTIHALVQFARLVNENAPTSDALQLLATALVEHAGADAVAIFQVKADRLVITASCNVPEQFRSWSAAADEMESALGRVLSDSYTSPMDDSYIAPS